VFRVYFYPSTVSIHDSVVSLSDSTVMLFNIQIRGKSGKAEATQI
jgi:hypothetical protein